MSFSALLTVHQFRAGLYLNLNLKFCPGSSYYDAESDWGLWIITLQYQWRLEHLIDNWTLPITNIDILENTYTDIVQVSYILYLCNDIVILI